MTTDVKMLSESDIKNIAWTDNDNDYELGKMIKSGVISNCKKE